jgi:hypothetical protein
VVRETGEQERKAHGEGDVRWIDERVQCETEMDILG